MKRACTVALLAIAASAQAAAEPPPLPEPALTESFAIGEALMDPARMDVAVVSLLARMDKTLPEPLVRGLIEMGVADLAASNDGRLPWSFRDLHAAIQPLLPGMSLEALAEAYSAAYAAAPDSLVPQVLLGMPIEPDTPLTRPQFWLLLVDGFAPPSRSPKLSQLGGAAAAPSSGSSWGTASLTLQQLPSPVPGLSQASFEYLLGILPMLAYQVPFEIQPITSSAHEGHGGAGTPIQMQARIHPSRQPALGPQGVLLQPGVGTSDNRMVWWNVRERARIERHGSFNVHEGVPVRTDVLGVARLGFSPKREASNNRGLILSDASSVEARISQWDLLSAYYQMPPMLAGFVRGDRSVQGVMEVRWHEENAMTIYIENIYTANMNLGFLGTGRRTGTDIADGVLSLLPDGSWQGEVKATVDMTQQLEGLGQHCPRTRFIGTQRLRVSAEPVDAFTLTQTIAVTNGATDGGFLALTFEPLEAPAIEPAGPCLDLYFRDPAGFRFLPLNDTRWTDERTRYVIGWPETGKLEYTDQTADGTAPGGPVNIGAFFQAKSDWTIRVERP